MSLCVTQEERKKNRNKNAEKCFKEKLKIAIVLCHNTYDMHTDIYLFNTYLVKYNYKVRQQHHSEYVVVALCKFSTNPKSGYFRQGHRCSTHCQGQTGYLSQSCLPLDVH